LGAEEVGLVELKLVELLVTFHLDDEAYHQDEEGGVDDPHSLAIALSRAYFSKMWCCMPPTYLATQWETYSASQLRCY
jgi:hypothetical protein